MRMEIEYARRLTILSIRFSSTTISNHKVRK
jgi:hypothetical protein